MSLCYFGLPWKYDFEKKTVDRRVMVLCEFSLGFKPVMGFA